MELVNGTKMTAAYTIGLDPDGRERVVVVVKGSFIMPTRGGVAQLADESDPLVFADEYTGKPGFSAVRYESDFAPFKPRCDVLLTGAAHVPNGARASSVLVGLRVGTMTKGFEVIGDRHWTAGMAGPTPSRPVPFTSMPISYDRAFGGANEASNENPSLRNAYAPNPVGVGYFRRARDEDVFSKPLPNTQEVHDPVLSPKGNYRPMSFGPIGRNFETRIPLAGTYDQRWLDDVFPFLPADFRPEYYQTAPSEQQIAHPVGGEVVQLVNLATHDVAPFQLPALALPVELTNSNGARIVQNAVVDTVVLEPERRLLHLVWRTSLLLRTNIREVTQAVVGTMGVGWYRARSKGKVYYPSLGALAREKARRP